MITGFKSRLQKIRDNNPGAGSGEVYRIALRGVMGVILAKWYLRKCNGIGRLTRVNGKPKVDNRGEIYLGEEVRVWSNIVKAKLLSGRQGVLKIGNNCRINGAHIDAQNLITIGNNCRISPYSILMDSNFHDAEDHMANVTGTKIIIEDNVWVATRAVVLGGVTLGKGSVIATGAVVTKDVEPYTMVGGIPAKFIKKLKGHPELIDEKQ